MILPFYRVSITDYIKHYRLVYISPDVLDQRWSKMEAADLEQIAGLIDQMKPAQKEKKKSKAISLKVISDWLLEQEKTYQFKYINDTK